MYHQKELMFHTVESLKDARVSETKILFKCRNTRFDNNEIEQLKSHRPHDFPYM